jgi:chromosome segregation ATPase
MTQAQLREAAMAVFDEMDKYNRDLCAKDQELNDALRQVDVSRAELAEREVRLKHREDAVGQWKKLASERLATIEARDDTIRDMESRRRAMQATLTVTQKDRDALAEQLVRARKETEQVQAKLSAACDHLVQHGIEVKEN